MVGLCIKIIGSKKSKKTAEYIVREHIEVAERTGGFVWFSTSQHLNKDSKKPDELMLYYIGNDGTERICRGDILYIKHSKNPFIPGGVNDEFSPFNDSIHQHIISYSPEAYSALPACTWFYIQNLRMGMIEDFRHLYLANDDSKLLSNVINSSGRTPRAFYTLK